MFCNRAIVHTPKANRGIVFNASCRYKRRDLAEFDERCFLLAFCGRSARYREIEHEIPVARQKGARIGVLCMAPAFRYAEACDHLLLCKGTGSSLDMLSADLLFTALSTTYRENFL